MVTVGTTKFDALMREVGRAEFARALRARGFSRLVVQHGNGGIVPELDAARAAGLDVECFAFRDDFGSVLAASDLVVGHAGAHAAGQWGEGFAVLPLISAPAWLLGPVAAPLTAVSAQARARSWRASARASSSSW